MCAKSGCAKIECAKKRCAKFEVERKLSELRYIYLHIYETLLIYILQSSTPIGNFKQVAADIHIFDSM